MENGQATSVGKLERAAVLADVHDAIDVAGTADAFPYAGTTVSFRSAGRPSLFATRRLGAVVCSMELRATTFRSRRLPRQVGRVHSSRSDRPKETCKKQMHKVANLYNGRHTEEN